MMDAIRRLEQAAEAAVSHLDYVRKVNPDGRDEEIAFEQAVDAAFALVRALRRAGAAK